MANKVLIEAIKNLLIDHHSGEDISDRLSVLEQAMELSEPGWSVAHELRIRYKTEKEEDETVL